METRLKATKPYEAKREHHLAMAKFHLTAAEFLRASGKTADSNAAYRLADQAALAAERLLPKSQRVFG